MRILIRIVFVIFIANEIDCLGGVCDDFCECLKEKEEEEKKEKEDDENNKENDEDKKEENNEEKNDENNEEKKENEKEDEKKDEGIMEYEEIKNEGNNTAISLVNYNWFSGKKNLVLKIFKKKGNNDFLSKDNGDKISIKLDENNNSKITYQKGAEDEPNLGGKKYAFFEIKTKKWENTVYLYCSDVESSGNKIDLKGIFSETDHISISVKACDTEKVTDMRYMFSGCRSLKELDLKIFNTKNVTNMGSMFCGCSKLENLNLNNFNTTKVTSMYSMFANCSSLKNLDISNFNTTKDLNINYMFYGCKSLEKLNISKFNIENYTNVDIIFKDCNNLPKSKINEILGKKK